MFKNKNFEIIISFAIFLLIGFISLSAQTTVINDPLKGSTNGAKKGGSFNSEGYAPGKGTNHILYDVPRQVTNGYVEFEMKGFSHSNMPKDENNGFLAIYDGRGISEPIRYSNDFKHNYFRWNIHWRQNKSAFKAVIACAAPTTQRINSSKAVFKDKNGNGLDSHDRDWYTEPTGSGQSWNSNSWYKVKVQWNKKKFEVFVNGVRKWSASGPYDYNPVDLKIWLGSAPGKYDSDVNVTYKNFKLVDLGGGGGITNSLTLSPASRSVGSSSGSTSFSVSSNVSWSSVDNASWATVSPGSGSNNGSLTVNFTKNTNSNSRTAQITTSGSGITRTATLVQAGASGTSNNLSVSPSSKSVGASSGSTTFSISSNVNWSTSENANWLTVFPSSGSNNATMTINYSANTSSNSRSATVTTSGSGITRSISITQAGVTGTGGGTLTVSPTSKEIDKKNGYFDISINTKGSWRVRDNSDWLSKKPKTGTGNGSSRITYKANTTGKTRTGIVSVTVGSVVKEIAVTQNSTTGTGGGTFSVSPANKSLGNNSGSFNISINTSGSWRVRDNTDWLSKKPKTGTGNGTSKITYKSNTTGVSRTGTITVTVGSIAKKIVITQSASTGQNSSIENLNDNHETISNLNQDESEVSIPDSYALNQNYPNPFNPTTLISFNLPTSSNVRLDIFNMLGEKISTLINGDLSAGYHSINFNATNLSAGTYIYRLQSSNFVQTKKMILLK